ncbi:MAG: ComEC/Rec2 family competence protein, partial [Actinomycetota bacterium]|nr:ComEC/Rec2 family competence protein [Actinomycetota bacterium]
HHVVGVLTATSAERAGAGTAPWRAANQVRRLLERGARSLPPGPRSLFSGFVLGDDRDQPASVSDDFRASGLTHLLVVSGENLAFVLALVAPLLRRLRLSSRCLVTVAAIAFFALITRGEPSVLRAAMMAGLSVSATTVGRPLSSIRLLAYAVASLVLIDPFLVGSVGFQLSVGASLGIVLLAPGLRRSLPGPAAIVDATAVTLAAQVGVAPVMISRFGGLPVAAVPANLLAVPVAGLVMMWGVGAGLLAGVLGGRPAALLHVPTRLMIAWISGVAERAARWPLGEIGPADAAVLAVGVAAVLVGLRATRSSLVRAGYGFVLLALVLPALALRWSSPALQSEPAAGVALWRDGGASVVELSSALAADQLLAALRASGVRRIDLLVLRRGGPTAAAQTAALRHRWAVRRVLQPSGGSVVGASVPSIGSERTVGGITVIVAAIHPVLQVDVHTRPARSARSARTGSRVGSLRAPRARSPPSRRHVPVRRRRHLEPNS